MPLLGGSLMRPVLGHARRPHRRQAHGLLGLTLTLAAAAVGWQFAPTLLHFSCSGFLLGVAGASFAVALPLASRWYPPEYQGLAMGIAGAGNSRHAAGDALRAAAGGALRLARDVRLRDDADGCACSSSLRSLLAGQPRRPHARDAGATTLRVLSEPDTLWLSLLYSGHVRRLRRLRQLPDDVLPRPVQLSRVRPATSRRSCRGRGQLPASGRRLALGSPRRHTACWSCCSSASASALASWPRCRRWRGGRGSCSSAMGCLGMGNGAVFQLVPQRFPERIGPRDRIVGAAGGLGGFVLPSVLGAIRDYTGSYRAGLLDVPRCFCAAWFCSSSSARGGRSDGTRRRCIAPGSIRTAHRSRGSMTRARPERRISFKIVCTSGRFNTNVASHPLVHAHRMCIVDRTCVVSLLCKSPTTRLT